MKKVWSLVFAFIFSTSFAYAQAQKADVTISLNEAFFDTLLDSVFQNFNSPEFPLTENRPVDCGNSIKVIRETNGVRTAVRFREGKIYVPLAFTGTYAPPFIGCVDFAGVADTNIDLDFDKDNQRLIGRATVTNVNLNGTGGLGGSVIAKLIQSSIDKKLNPIEIISLDKVSFAFPIQNVGSLKMKAVGVRHEIANGVLNVIITYQFVKA